MPINLNLKLIMIVLGAGAMAACSSGPAKKAGPASGGGGYKVGSPYKIKGKWYHPRVDPNYNRVGTASWYGRDFHGKKTANGEIFDMNRISAAHTTLPLPSIVEVENLSNRRKIRVRVNDRGPFAHNRIIDLSREAARELGFEQKGLARVRVRYVGKAPLRALAPRRNEPVRTASEERLREASPVSEASTRVAQSDLPAQTPASIGPEPAEDTGLRAPEDRGSSTTLASQELSVSEDLVGRDVPGALGEADPQTDQAPAALASRSPDLPPDLNSNLATDLPTAAVTSASYAVPQTIDEDQSESTLPSVDEIQPDQKQWAIQVASLSNLSNVEGLKDSLSSIGEMNFSRNVLDDGRVFYRITMGPFSSLENAQERLDAVRAAGYNDAVIVAKPN